MKRWSLAAVVLTALLAPSAATARSVRDEPYPYETTWNAALRLLRIDLGCTIQERDQEVGYFTFTWREGTRTYPGSVELVRAQVDGRAGTRVIVQVPQMPTYVETLVLSRLGRKLRTEYGEPPALPPPRRPEAPPPGDPPQTPANPGTPTPPDTPTNPTNPAPPTAPVLPSPTQRPTMRPEGPHYEPAPRGED
ncbi:MAG: hypothetical protein HY909_20360 [Deltaproteobacteria bacterium]|nr:hypothetical protein [Deltaproteobacteria bacterium]